MNKELKAKWVSALRSGEYRQGKGYLCRDGAYCCWGVLRSVADPSDTREICSGRVVTADQLDEWGLGKDFDTSPLENMNDGMVSKPQKSFSEIADYIEKTL